jgi:hypothetical protein
MVPDVRSAGVIGVEVDILLRLEAGIPATHI